MIEKYFNIKLILFGLFISIVTGIFSLNQIVITQLRNEAVSQAEHLATSYSNAINSMEQDDIRFVIDILLPSIKFPMIITSNDEISVVLNLNISDKVGSEAYKQKIWTLVDKMDQVFDPLDLVWENVKWGEIHYSDPQVVNRLKWIPYLEILFGTFFIIIATWGFKVINKSEQRMIYVGMAKETAHQLGTPISSLMGWVKLIREDKSDMDNISLSMEQDIQRLSEISKRFSKIGSMPKLKKLFIDDLIIENITYMKNRLSNESNIKIIYEGPRNIYIKGDWVLLSWAFENLLKNSIDAIINNDGIVKIVMNQKESFIQFDIIDTGKGIIRTDWNKVFNPGYSSKVRGWGLGLSLTLRIFEEIHDGSIELIFSKPGETIFRVKIPKFI